MNETVQVADCADVICGLKAAVTALECQYNMRLLEEQSRRKKKQKPRQPTMFMMIPIEQKRNGDDGSLSGDKMKRRRNNRNEGSSDSCSGSIASSNHQKRKCGEVGDATGPKMRGGVVHGRCGCLYHDGLQDSCPLTECQGQPQCLTKPWATCPPAMYYRKQFPEIWPPAAADSIDF